MMMTTTTTITTNFYVCKQKNTPTRLVIDLISLAHEANTLAS